MTYSICTQKEYIYALKETPVHQEPFTQLNVTISNEALRDTRSLHTESKKPYMYSEETYIHQTPFLERALYTVRSDDL